MRTLPLLIGLLLCASAQAAPQCYGRPADGRITGAVALTTRGANFAPYSVEAVALGRTFVHPKVARIVSDAYQALQHSNPDWQFVYGETGLVGGGPFPPHKTHQNGLSVDFFVPVRNAQGASVALPSSRANRYGYDIEFDAQGRSGEYQIDFEALAEHLYQLQSAAEAQKVQIQLLIIDPAFLPKLYASSRGQALRKLRLMAGKPWVRHDEHFHIDFAIPCLAAE